MRSQVIAGRGSVQPHGVALVNGARRMRTVSGVDIDTANLDASGIWGMVSGIASDVWSAVCGVFDEDPPTGGAAVTPQFADLWNNPAYHDYLNNYYWWLSEYHRADVWDTGRGVWADTLPGWSPWYWAYKALVDRGMPMGTRVDSNMIPLNWDQVAEAVTGGNVNTTQDTSLSADVQNACAVLAVQLSGALGLDVKAQAEANLSQLPAALQTYVRGLAAAYLASLPQTGNDGTGADTNNEGAGAGNNEAGFGSGGLVLLGVAALALLNK